MIFAFAINGAAAVRASSYLNLVAAAAPATFVCVGKKGQ